MSEPLEHDHDTGISRRALWFGWLGGAMAWLVHLFLLYLIAEWGCLSGFRQVMVLGVTGIAWSLMAASLVPILVCGAAAWVAQRNARRLRTHERDVTEERDPKFFLARAGLIMNILFAVVILVQTVPIFYFLEHC